MRRSIVTVLAAGVSMAAWCGGASAQGVGVDLYVGPGYGTYNDYSGLSGLSLRSSRLRVLLR